MTCTRISRDVYILAAEFNALVAGHERDSHDEYDSFVHSLWQGLRAEKPEHSTLTERDLLSKLSHHPDLVKNCTIEGMTAVISVFFCVEDAFDIRLNLLRDDEGMLGGPGESTTEINMIRLSGKWYYVRNLQTHDRDDHGLRYHEPMYFP